MNPIYLKRRQDLLAAMRARGGGVALLATAPEVARNSDSDYPYRHDSSFYYLTGFVEPESALVLLCGATPAQDKSILFCREKNIEREIWDGYRYGPPAAAQAFGMTQAFDIAQIETELPPFFSNAPHLFYSFGRLRAQAWDARVYGALNAVRALARNGVSAPSTMVDVNILIDEMRLIKDAHEQAIMRRAAHISGEAHARAMRATQVGMREYQIEAELLHAFRWHGAQFPAYGSIVATGANACVLHYRADNAQIADGDLILIDAGCELDGYAADITRTYPANGKFTGAQAALYDIVLAAQAAAIAAIKPGAAFMAYHEAAVTVLAQGMIDVGLCHGSLSEVIEEGRYKQFYMHRTGHWLGMDVHDVGDYREMDDMKAAKSAPMQPGETKPWRALQAGMVLTVEPGIYVRPAQGVPEVFWNIGIRIEDDAIVTAQGCEIITDSAPKARAEIEALVGRGRLDY